MMGHGTKFGRKKEETIAALLSQRNVEEAARFVNIEPRLCSDGCSCRSSIRPTGRLGAQLSHNRLRGYNRRPARRVATLLKIMVDPSAPAASRIRAADSVLGTRPRRSRSKTSKREFPNWNGPPSHRRTAARRVANENQTQNENRTTRKSHNA